MNTIKTYFHNIFHGAQRAMLWLRGTLTALATTLVQWAMLKSDDVTSLWTLRDWAKHAAPVVVMFLVGLAAHGEKNPETPKAP